MNEIRIISAIDLSELFTWIDTLCGTFGHGKLNRWSNVYGKGSIALQEFKIKAKYKEFY